MVVASYRGYRFDVPQAKRLASLAGADIDMHAVIQHCRRLELMYSDWNAFDFELADALSSAAAVRYGRCFKSGVRERLPEAALGHAPSSLKDTHRFVIELRDKHVAHSVNPFEENEVTVQIADHFVSSNEIFAINTAQGRAMGFPSDKPTQLQELAVWWLEWLKIEMNREKEDLLRLARTLPLETLKRGERAVLASDTSPRTVGKRRPRP